MISFWSPARFGLMLLALWALAEPARAQDEARPDLVEARIPVKIVGGRLVARCELVSAARRVPANLFVDFENPCGLELHNAAASHLGIESEDGTTRPVRVRVPGFDIEVERRDHGDQDLLAEFTRIHSAELGEVSCVGTIGARLLARYHVVFDLPSGFVVLRPPAPRSERPPEPVTGSVLVPASLVSDMVWFPVGLEGGRSLMINLGSSRYDTVVDEDLCFELDRPAGDLGRVLIGGAVELSAYAALRPERLVLAHPDGAFGTLGLGVLASMRIEVDRVNRWVRVTPLRPPVFPEADLAFFRARAEEEVEPLLAFLKEHGQSRLGREAAELALEMFVDSGASLEDLRVALDWVHRTRFEDLRATEALKTMETLVQANRPAAAVEAGRLGIEGGRKDRYPESVHKLHARLGEILLDEGRVDEAWEHLLSAAFGLPEDGPINLALGRVYEAQGRFRRAMSRYIQAVVTPEAGARAVSALEELQPKMSGEPLSVDLVDRLVAGKVRGFTAATRFEADESTRNQHCALAELFTNPHFGRPNGESWVSFGIGGAMAAEGLLSHFPRERLALVSYHLPVPESCATMTELGQNTARAYGIDSPEVLVVDGRLGGPGAGRWRDAEEIFDRNRANVVTALQEVPDYAIAIEARVEDGVVVGEVTATGPWDEELVLQVLLVEKGVLYPGKSEVVVHRMLARSELTGSFEGLPWDPRDGRMVHAFRKSLDQVTAENVAFLERFEDGGGAPTTRLSVRLDPRQMAVVAYLRHGPSRRVLQAAFAEAPVAADDDEKEEGR